MHDALTFYYRDGNLDVLPALLAAMDAETRGDPSARKTFVGFHAGLRDAGVTPDKLFGLPFREERERGWSLDIANFPIKKPCHLDWCWAHFMASGDLTGPRRVMRSALHSRGLLKRLAQWSLASNASAHEPVLGMCQTAESTAAGAARAWLASVVVNPNGAARRAYNLLAQTSGGLNGHSMDFPRRPKR